VMPNAQLNLIPGRRYRITYRSDTQRRDRYSVMDYMHQDPNGEMVFSARPEFGTQVMPRKWVKKIELVPTTTKIVMGRIF
jgi:hypothetical protein